MKKAFKNFSVLELHKDQLRYEQDLLQSKKSHQGCWARVKSNLLELYNHKCAYCEMDLRKTTSTIDHYRPRARNKYYWLAHEWTNFLPCCNDCQKKGSEFETDRAPQYIAPLLLNGNLDYERCLLDNSYLLVENPLILNPEYDSPHEHLGFDTKNGNLLVKNNSKKAEVTIRIVNLNRIQLQFCRKQVVDDFFEQIDKYYETFNKSGIPAPLPTAIEVVKNEIQEKISKRVEYSFVWQYILENFESILESE